MTINWRNDFDPIPANVSGEDGIRLYLNKGMTEPGDFFPRWQGRDTFCYVYYDGNPTENFTVSSSDRGVSAVRIGNAIVVSCSDEDDRADHRITVSCNGESATFICVYED